MLKSERICTHQMLACTGRLSPSKARLGTRSITVFATPHKVRIVSLFAILCIQTSSAGVFVPVARARMGPWCCLMFGKELFRVPEQSQPEQDTQPLAHIRDD